MLIGVVGTGVVALGVDGFTVAFVVVVALVVVLLVERLGVGVLLGVARGDGEPVGEGLGEPVIVGANVLGIAGELTEGWPAIATA